MFPHHYIIDNSIFSVSIFVATWNMDAIWNHGLAFFFHFSCINFNFRLLYFLSRKLMFMWNVQYLEHYNRRIFIWNIYRNETSFFGRSHVFKGEKLTSSKIFFQHFKRYGKKWTNCQKKIIELNTFHLTEGVSCIIPYCSPTASFVKSYIVKHFQTSYFFIFKFNLAQSSF